VRAAASRWPYLPLAIAGVYLIVLLAHLRAIVDTMAQSADVVVAHQLAELISSHSGAIVLGDSAWYSTLLFELATRRLPFYRPLWDLAPFIATAISFLAIAWSAWRVAGRWAGAMTLSLLVCAGASLLTQYGALDNHVLTWTSDSLLIAGLVWVLYPSAPRRRSRWLPLAIALGLLVALNLASDRLLYAGGIAPVVVASLVAWRRSPGARTREGVLYALATSAVAIAGALLVVHFMRQHQIGPNPGFVITFAHAGALSGNFSLWWQSLALLGGDFSAKSITLAPIVYLCASGLTLAAILLIPRLAQLELRGASASRVPGGGRASSSGEQPRVPARDAFVAAWATSALLVSAAFVLSSTPVGLGTIRYLVGVPLAAAALVPLLARRRETVALVVAAASIYCVSGVLSIARGEASQPSGVTQQEVNTFVRLAAATRAGHGYTGYWDASPITWKSRFRVLAYPARQCGAGICRFALGYDSSWYKPSGSTRSFLITDTAQPYMPSAPTTLGPPAASYRVDSKYTFLVYDYDIASKIQP